MPLGQERKPALPRGSRVPMWRAMARLWTLLALVAILLMPLGMTAAPAMAEAPPAAGGHCDEDHEPSDAPANAQVHCTGCAGLPALAAPAGVERMPPEAPAAPAVAEAFSGVEPGTDPPPPKRS